MPYKGRVGQFVHQLKKLPRQLADSSLKHKQMVWLAGVQRSGTNMMMDALDRHSLTRVFHEADQSVFEDYNLKNNEEIAKHFKRTMAKVVVAKALLDADRIAELMSYFEDAKVIWPVRNFSDVINSHIVRWAGFREWVDEIVAGGHKHNWRGRNISSHVEDILDELYFPECSVADCKALFWLIRNQIFFDEKLDANPNAMVLRYEDFVQNPKQACEVMAEFTGLKYEASMIDGIHSRSIRKSPPPEMNDRIKKACLDMEERLIAECAN